MPNILSSVVSSHFLTAESTSPLYKISWEIIAMIFWSFTLLLGVCFSHRTTASPLRHGNCLVDIEKRTLISVIATANSATIDLSGLQIERIGDKAFDGLTNVKSLNLSNNKLQELSPRIFSKLHSLEELSLAHNDISSLKYAFIGLNNLKHLNISNTAMFELNGGDLFGLSKSTEIITEGNNYNLISSDVFQDPSTRLLEFDIDTRIFPNSVREPNVEPLSRDFNVKLCKSNDGIVKSVEELKHSEALGDCMKVKVNRKKRSLYLNDLDLKEFQRGWYKLPVDSIRHLHLSRNYIRHITPELLNDLPSGLSSIDLEYNKIEIIKRNIIENRYWKKINLENNSLSTIEDGAFKNTNLTSLSAGRNRLDNLDFVRTLPTSLKELKLSKNLITDIPVDTFRGFKDLRLIDLDGNNVRKLRTGIFRDQENLSKLRLQDNQISELNPGAFKGLTMLNQLILHDNKIEKISHDTFSELRNSNLSMLHLDFNKIDTIEEGSFANMNIGVLGLINNRITDQSIAKGSFNGCSVYVLHLQNNSITEVNEESFYGAWRLHFLHFAGNKITSIKKISAECMTRLEVLDLTSNPLERLENGALHGLSKSPPVLVFLWDTPIKYIQGGVFDDV